MREYVIEGARIDGIPALYDELNRLFMAEEDWRLGDSLDALDDLLYGGFGDRDGRTPARIVWRDAALSRAALGVEATADWLRGKLDQPTVFAVDATRRRLEAVLAGTGPTYFDLVLEVFAGHPEIELELRFESERKDEPMHPDLSTLPKAELHLHVEGTLEPELAFELAARNRVALPYADVAELRRHYDFDDLQSFLDLYYACTRVLRTARDFTDLAVAYFARAHADGVRHVEMFFDPQVHAANGVAVSTVIDGLLAGFETAAERWGISGGLIVCIVRDLPVADAEALLDAIAPRAHELLGIGLDSAEVGYPPSLFAGVFARAAELGLHRVAHAGEEAPADYVWPAVRLLGVERVDHGIRSIDDPALVRHLAEHRIPLTVCPLSNVRLRAVADPAAHPLPRLVAAGVIVTVNSDDPAYFGGYIGDNYDAVAAMGVDAAGLAQLAENSIEASFADAGRKAELLGLIREWATLTPSSRVNHSRANPSAMRD